MTQATYRPTIETQQERVNTRVGKIAISERAFLAMLGFPKALIISVSRDGVSQMIELLVL